MQKTFQVMEAAVGVATSWFSRRWYKYERLRCKNKKRKVAFWRSFL